MFTGLIHDGVRDQKIRGRPTPRRFSRALWVVSLGFDGLVPLFVSVRHFLRYDGFQDRAESLKGCALLPTKLLLIHHPFLFISFYFLLILSLRRAVAW
ncbi:hypothetical protein BDW02DRAFT_89002 [Decorospora gaudefroyi]|uniref:Uncharacterized protein n=1 Tax=Decorospora gaudefroyi TaxID=184978 RepID=A0A6A5K2W6_9PLEO|nr:hypothetical protein BDW02DRAFT_89002 [Decorospora gaudefroyi]